MLVREKGAITGIVTVSDLSIWFQELSTPFLLLGEIERQLRNILAPKFSLEELKSYKNPNDPDHEINSIDDLTFGAYLRIFENPDCWNKIGLTLSRTHFHQSLTRVKDLRNDVMHFDPSSNIAEDVLFLNQFAAMLRKL